MDQLEFKDYLLFTEAAQSFNEEQGIAKAVIDVKDANGRGCLHFAAQNGKDTLCSYLLKVLKYPVDVCDNDGEEA